MEHEAKDEEEQEEEEESNNSSSSPPVVVCKVRASTLDLSSCEEWLVQREIPDEG